MRTEAPLLAPVFRSEGQAKLLAALLLGSEPMSLSDLAVRAELAYASAHRECEKLLEADILQETRAGRTRMICANESSPLVPPLREILLIATGPVVLLSEGLGRIQGIESAFLYGSFAARMKGVPGPPPADIDLMVIGSPDPQLVVDLCQAVSVRVHRDINPTILTPEEFASSGGFARDVQSKPVIPVCGALPW